jgi:hypothetical protein
MIRVDNMPVFAIEKKPKPKRSKDLRMVDTRHRKLPKEKVCCIC